MAKKKKRAHKAMPSAADASSANAKAEARAKQKRVARHAAKVEATAQTRANRKAKLQQRGLLVGAGVIVIGLFAWSIIRSLPDDGDTSVAAWDLPAEANDPDGDGRVTLAEFQGTPVVVNFYADWCEACHGELPAFARVSDEMRERVQFVGINTQDDKPFAMPELHGVDWWPLASDINGTLGGGSGLYNSVAQSPGMPITAFYSAEGQWLGSTSVLDEAGLRAEIAQRFGIQ